MPLGEYNWVKRLSYSDMNRKKKLQSLFKKRLKRARAKLDGRPKERYISKADRAKAEAEANVKDAVTESEVEQPLKETE